MDAIAAERDRLAGQQAQREPPLTNVEAATTPHDEGRLEYRGRTYRVPPIRWRTRLELAALDEELRRLGLRLGAGVDVPTLRRVRDVVTEMLNLFGTLIIWHWWQVRNPLLDADEEEFRLMRSFFLTARTRCRVVAVRSVRAPHWLRTTWPPASAGLQVGLRAGWPAPSPAAGLTSRSASAP